MNDNSNSIRIGNLFGIPFYIKPSWFFVLGLITLTYGGQLASFSGLTGVLPWFFGLIAALLLFASVLAHELGHSFAAMSQGIQVKSITLFIFGGLAALEKESETPLGSFLVAIAGPLVSVLLFGIFTIVNATVALPTALGAIVSLLAYINLVLALFNMIPGLPLDGGNVLKAIVWKATGSPNKGVIIAGRVGQVFGWLAVGIGLLGTLNLIPFGSFWTLLIGFFLLQNAGFAAQSATVQDKLDGFTAEDAVIPDSPIVTAGLTLREFVNEYVIGKQQWRKFLVVDAERHLMGEVLIDDLKLIPTSEWTQVQLAKLVKPVREVTKIAANLSLLEVVKMIETQNIKEMVVIRKDEEVLGLLEKTSITDLLQGQAQS